MIGVNALAGRRDARAKERRVSGDRSAREALVVAHREPELDALQDFGLLAKERDLKEQRRARGSGEVDSLVRRLARRGEREGCVEDARERPLLVGAAPEGFVEDERERDVPELWGVLCPGLWVLRELDVEAKGARGAEGVAAFVTVRVRGIDEEAVQGKTEALGIAGEERVDIVTAEAEGAGGEGVVPGEAGAAEGEVKEFKESVRESASR